MKLNCLSSLKCDHIHDTPKKYNKAIGVSVTDKYHHNYEHTKFISVSDIPILIHVAKCLTKGIF